jgi:type IV secretory pathway TrbD component
MTMRLHVWCVAVWLLHSVVVQAADPWMMRQWMRRVRASK